MTTRASQGFTHVEFLPVAEHPYEGLWGYHVTGYFAPVSRLGSPDEFRHLVDALHQAGIGVIIDWVPWPLRHRSLGAAALRRHRLVRARGPRLGWHPDWGAYIFTSAGTR